MWVSAKTRVTYRKHLVTLSASRDQGKTELAVISDVLDYAKAAPVCVL